MTLCARLISGSAVLLCVIAMLLPHSSAQAAASIAPGAN